MSVAYLAAHALAVLELLAISVTSKTPIISVAVQWKGKREGGHETGARGQAPVADSGIALEEDLHANQNAFVQVDVASVWRVQLGIKVAVTGKQLRVADNTVVGTQLQTGHLFRVTK